jgi:Flp pilus assembly protein CpaB
VGKFLIVIAVILGIFVVVVINGQFKTLEEKANPKTRLFYRATADVQPGLTVEEAASDGRRLIQKTTPLPEEFARQYPGAVDEVSFSIFAKKPIVRPLKAGEFLQQSHLEPLTSAEVQMTIPEGMKVVAIGVTAASSVGYLIAPGDYVDVYITASHQDPKAPGGSATEARLAVDKPLLVYAVDDVRATADGTPVRPRGKSYSTVSLLVTAKQAEELIVALQSGKATLALTRKPAAP